MTLFVACFFRSLERLENLEADDQGAILLTQRLRSRALL